MLYQDSNAGQKCHAREDKTLTQEAIRVLRNTSPAIGWERKAELLSDFSHGMKLSGYGERYRLTIIQSALAAWEKLVNQDKTGEKPLYRERQWKKEAIGARRRRKRTNGKISWEEQLMISPSSVLNLLEGDWVFSGRKS